MVHVKSRFAVFERPADKQRERTFRGFVFVSLVFKLFDAVQNGL